MKPYIYSVLLSSLILSACSPIVNTVNGLTTFQSTISGSNYPFAVDPQSGKLQISYTEIDAKALISKNESFEIVLDSLFLRYLQASDPYVMIYSEAWMGSEVMPLDKKKLQRQIVLIKDGLSYNAKQPITSIPILGPVTMGDDSLDVHVSLYVVVLSKNDNQQTVDFLSGVAAVASTAAPQYALIAGAAADVGKTIVAQNRDKIEFEHTFNLTPIHTVNGVFNHKKEFGPNLAEGKLVVIKGENKDRLVPYNNWFYYISPLNWLGHTPTLNSTQFETTSNHLKLKYLNNDFSFFNLYDESANYTLLNIPYGLLKYFILPDNAFITQILNKDPTSPENISVCGNYLLTTTSEKTAKQACNIDSNYGEDLDNTFIQRLYHDKTYAILSVRRTEGSYGNFSELYSAFDKAGYGAQIDNLATTRDQSLTKSKEAADLALQSMNTAIAFERTKRQLSTLAVQGLSSSKTIDDIVTDTTGISTDDQTKLKNIYWEELTVQSAKRLKSKIDSIIHVDNPPSAKDFCSKFVSQISYEQNYWRITGDAKLDPTTTNRDIAWSSILQGISNYLWDSDKTKQYVPVITDNIQKLNIQDLGSPDIEKNMCDQ
jgi:hypothetical protein